MDIDAETLKVAEKKFKARYGSFDDLGLSRTGRKKLLTFGKVPANITNLDESRELLNISFEYKRILDNVMKPHYKKGSHS